MLLVFCFKITNRMRYIFEYILEDRLGLSFTITTDREAFLAHKGMKINYSSRQFGDELFFYATPLLFERGIKKQRIKIGYFEDMPNFFISKSNSDIPFDLFAASFYLLSRYEEYLPTKKDKLGRYPAEASLAYHYQFLQKPVIDFWVQQLRGALVKRYPTDLPSNPRTYYFLPTYDIDMVYAYRCKDLVRQIGGYALALKNLDFAAIQQRTQVLLGMNKDPYDTFDWIHHLNNRYQLKPVYFFLVGEYGIYDKNISIQNNDYQDIVQSIGDHYQVGIHPSFRSNTDAQARSQEINDLANVLKKEITRSRQHYLKLTIPETYQQLQEYDIIKDYSMGYPSQLGFRASTAASFYFYDLTLEIKTKIKIYPFVAMDVTLKNYLYLTQTQALRSVRQLIEVVRSVDGLFTTIWHNHTLSKIEGWKGWREVYEEIVKLASE